MKTLTERFEEKIREDASGCWVWIGATTPSGYGQKWNGTKVVPAHRWSYEHHIGAIPPGLQLDHLCRNRACVNPWHLEPVTNQENSVRGIAGEVNGGRERAKTHCPQGHPYDAGNTYVRPDRGTRECRQCHRDHRRIRRSRRPL